MNGLATRMRGGIDWLPFVRRGLRRLIHLLITKRYEVPLIARGKFQERTCMDMVGTTQAFVSPLGEFVWMWPMRPPT